MSATTLHLDTAIRFVKALDASDDGTIAGRMLAEDCIYTIRDRVYTGRDAIMATYVGSDRTARKKFDRVEYESQVSPSDDGRYVIQYLDRLTHNGQVHEHRCQQILSFDETGVICRIEHVDLPGESEALESFLDRVGLTLDG
ncbi:MAG: hypothetical protein V3T84_03595 [Phycisphaerales bacterium]